MNDRVSARRMISRKLRAERAVRQPIAVSLEGKLFERFIEELSASFVRSTVGEIGGEIDRWIREIVLGLNLDRGALGQVDAKSGKLVVRHSWSRDHIFKLPIGLEFAEIAPWFNGVMMSGRTLAYSKVSELPAGIFQTRLEGVPALCCEVECYGAA